MSFSAADIQTPETSTYELRDLRVNLQCMDEKDIIAVQRQSEETTPRWHDLYFRESKTKEEMLKNKKPWFILHPHTPPDSIEGCLNEIFADISCLEIDYEIHCIRNGERKSVVSLDKLSSDGLNALSLLAKYKPKTPEPSWFDLYFYEMLCRSMEKKEEEIIEQQNREDSMKLITEESL